VTILSAVADRFGLWGPPRAANVSWGDWPHFVAYTATRDDCSSCGDRGHGSRGVAGRGTPSGSLPPRSRLGELRVAGALRRCDDPVVRYQGTAELLGFRRRSSGAYAQRLAGDTNPQVDPSEGIIWK